MATLTTQSMQWRLPPDGTEKPSIPVIRNVIRNEDLALTRNSFTIRGPETWNQLPRNIRNEPTIRKFKLKLRKWLSEKIPRFI